MVQPNEYGTHLVQNELLVLMKVFHKFCEENDIKYMLYGGSCLGAIRHKGFIPWDDDLDICVDRDNYVKLIQSINQSENDTITIHRHLWIDRIQNKDAAPIKGYIPTLDVFVIDNAPDNNLLFSIKVLLLAALQGMLKEEVNLDGFTLKYKILLLVTHFMGLFVSDSLLNKLYDSISQFGNNNHTKMVHCANTSYGWIQRRYPSNTWVERTLAEFEDTKLYIPYHYNAYLSKAYGDYMKLPDYKDRIPEHLNK